MLKVGILGVTGYTGEELIKILIRHPHVKLTYLARHQDKEQNIDEVFPYLKNVLGLKCEVLDLEKAISRADLFFLALPHTASLKVVPILLNHKKKVIDLSADYRLQDTKTYKDWYKIEHLDKKNLKAAVYGLPELSREKIKKANIVANPGCYPTAAILGIIPALVSGIVETNSIIIDAKSGVSGAGKKVAVDYLYSEINGVMKTYKLNEHQHMPEINQVLSQVNGKKIEVIFSPHLIPMNRGILETIYLKLKKKISQSDVLKIYQRFYKTEPFVRLREGADLSTKNVLGTNFCDIGLKVDEEKKALIVVSVIDNLLKGASGQAVQNMNIMYGFSETSALV